MACGTSWDISSLKWSGCWRKAFSLFSDPFGILLLNSKSGERYSQNSVFSLLCGEFRLSFVLRKSRTSLRKSNLATVSVRTQRPTVRLQKSFSPYFTTTVSFLPLPARNVMYSTSQSWSWIYVYSFTFTRLLCGIKCEHKKREAILTIGKASSNIAILPLVLPMYVLGSIPLLFTFK